MVGLVHELAQYCICWYHHLGTLYTVKWTVIMFPKKKAN